MSDIEFARWEYQALAEEFRRLEGDINRNYQWVLATTGLILGSQFLGLRWDEVGSFVNDHAGWFMVAAVGALWFPACDVNMWGDMRMIGTYIAEELEPRLGRRATRGTTYSGWAAAREAKLIDAKPYMFPVWFIRMSQPYWTTLILTGIGLWPREGPYSRPWWFWLALGVWFVGMVLILRGMLKRGVVVPELPRRKRARAWRLWVLAIVRIRSWLRRTSRELWKELTGD